MGDWQFGGRLVLRDGTTEADLVIDIDRESMSLTKGDQLLGQYLLNDVHFLRWSEHRIILDLAGEKADFYPLRPEEFVATLHDTVDG
ncbi:MAG: hypothetical protein ACXWH0_16590 [Acidimicrobiia bacterium]